MSFPFLSPCSSEARTDDLKQCIPPAMSDNIFRLVVEGEPIAKARVRAVRRGSYLAFFDPQETAKQLTRVDIALKFKTSPRPKEVSLCVFLIFYCKPKGNIAQIKRKLWNFDEHIQKPDCDNLVKYILDCGNQILWTDDSQIVTIQATKRFSDKPRTEIIMVDQTQSLDVRTQEILAHFEPCEIQELFNELYPQINHEDLYKLPFDDRNKLYESLARHLVRFAKMVGKRCKKLAEYD